MGDTISLTTEVQRRVRILTHLVGDDLAIEEAAELLTKHEGIDLSRPSRERMPCAGMLAQVDGIRHDWLEGRGPWLSLVGGIDDATGSLVGATFRDEEDNAGYLQLITDIARAHDRASASVVLADWLPRFNAAFTVPARDPEPAWRAVPDEVDLAAVCAFRYERVIANDATVRIGGLVLDVPRQPNGRSLAGKRVEVRLEPDGRIVVADGKRRLLVTEGPMEPGACVTSSRPASRCRRSPRAHAGRRPAILRRRAIPGHVRAGEYDARPTGEHRAGTDGSTEQLTDKVTDHRQTQVEIDFQPLSFDADAARAFERVADSRRRAGRKTTTRTYDAMIAAVAIANQLPLYTCNPRDFQHIDGREVVTVPMPTLEDADG